MGTALCNRMRFSAVPRFRIRSQLALRIVLRFGSIQYSKNHAVFAPQGSTLDLLSREILIEKFSVIEIEISMIASGEKFPVMFVN